MFQSFSGGLIDNVSADLPTITATTETVLVPTLLTPFGVMNQRAGQVYKLTVWGSVTTGTAGTLIITPRYGLTIGGTSMTASPTQNYVPSITTAPFTYECWVAFRSIQIATGASTAVHCSGRWISGGAVATAASSTVVTHATLGTVNVDASAAAALWIGVTFSVAPSVIPRGMLWKVEN